MPRLLMPSLVVTAGFALAAALTATRFTTLIESASSDERLYNLIARALHDSELGPGPIPGSSPLSIGPVPQTPEVAPVNPEQAESPTAPQVTEQPQSWVTRAAAADSGALRDWLSPWVLATSTPAHDTVVLTLRRFSTRHDCPWVSTLEARSVRVDGESRIVAVDASCPDLTLSILKK